MRRELDEATRRRYGLEELTPEQGWKSNEFHTRAQAALEALPS